MTVFILVDDRHGVLRINTAMVGNDYLILLRVDLTMYSTEMMCFDIYRKSPRRKQKIW